MLLTNLKETTTFQNLHYTKDSNNNKQYQNQVKESLMIL